MENAAGFFVERGQMAWYWAQYLAEEGQRNDPLASPRHVPSLSGLPLALIVTAEHDPVRDETERHGARLQGEGVESEVMRYDGQIHGFMDLPGTVADAETALDALSARLGEQLWAEA
jgi:acetyl esterase